ncbi:MAG: DUF3536 domain-containing protein [Cyanobacteria bacterium SIG30]|nr:DUF3536 domain-containing protein [Cyanobacteria bacterium SIG30]
MKEHKKYLTIHGHFYQPPRENPWLEEIELQDSAKPFHNWNARISHECYEPNSVSRIAGMDNRVLNIVNNYEYMSFNFGPTLLSWMQKYAKKTYKKILLADKNSRKMYGGHSCAIAQVYNHIIMPLANEKDKITQVVWGTKDYEKRFGHKPEGIWLAETAVDGDTLEILIKQNIKFTILSPYQAQKVRKFKDANWQDVSCGSIDPSMPYRYFSKENPKKYIDIYFYDGAISKSVAFDELLKDGKKFAYRLNDGYAENRNRVQLVNIATDGESYGHHTKFGDMALSYVLTVKAKDLGFQITNYGQFLEIYPPTHEVEIKPESSWSCCHGVGRWMEDCGCSTGAMPGWNQRWRAPLRKALDDLRNDLIVICQIEGNKYFKDFWGARNDYIDVILNRKPENVEKFLSKHQKKKLSQKDKINAIKLLEIQRQAMLMYTSCGWFFAEISGIETVQIMKYAARAMELAQDFSKENLEKKFLNTLSKAISNIPSYGNGANIYEKFVKPSMITVDQLASHWAISSIYVEEDENSKIYCYNLKKSHFRKHKFKNAIVVSGKVEIESTITFEKWERVFTAAATSDGEIYCILSEKDDVQEVIDARQAFEKEYKENNCTNFKRLFKKHFKGKNFSLKEVLIDRRKTLMERFLEEEIAQFENIYKNIYQDMKPSITHLIELGLDIPEVFRLAAKYTITTQLEKLLSEQEDFNEKEFIEKIITIKKETDTFNINLNKTNASEILRKRIQEKLLELMENPNTTMAQEVISMFDAVDLLDLNLEIRVAQNIYFEDIYKKLGTLAQKLENASINKKNKERRLALLLLKIGELLNINTDFYKDVIDKATLPKH